ncbi:cysteine--tRNA ligase, partial [Flavobacteriaceae bacterium]|nr:cysteine--tRNA ligase [Flavobacteriaceae bacterium]
ETKCYAAMNDDFNSPILIAQLFDAIKFINAVGNGAASISAVDQEKLLDTILIFVEEVMGITLNENENKSSITAALEGTISMLIDIRKTARDNKDFATSDRIRDELLALGVQLKDGKDGTGFSI